MTELEKLKEERQAIDKKLDKAWFKIKLSREARSYYKYESKSARWAWLKENYTPLIEEHQELSQRISELEQQEREQRLAAIWNED